MKYYFFKKFHIQTSSTSGVCSETSNIRLDIFLQILDVEDVEHFMNRNPSRIMPQCTILKTDTPQSLCNKFNNIETFLNSLTQAQNLLPNMMSKSVLRIGLNLVTCPKGYLSFKFGLTLLEKSSYSDFSWPVFFHIQTEYGEILRSFPYSVQMRENAAQKNFKYGNFSGSVIFP